MKKKEIYNNLNDEEELSALIYSLITTADSIFKKQRNFKKYNPIKFLITALYNEEIPVYKHLEFVTRKGGARYVMNDVSSYRKAKDYEVEKIKIIKKLFKRFNCKTKEDIINFITHIYINRDKEIKEKNEIIKKALMAYQVYYKNNISLSTWPKDSQIYSDFISYTINKDRKDKSFMDSCIGLGISKNYGSKVLKMNHLRYPNAKMLVIADGTGTIEEENAAFIFCEYINEWFWKSNPYEENYEEKLADTINLINYEIGERDKDTEASISVVIITNEKTYISSIGNTRVYLVNDGNITKVPHKESLYDELIEKGKRIPFTKEYAQSIPYETIGHKIKEKNSCKPEVITVLTSLIDGIIAISYGVYQNASDQDIETILKNCVVEDTAEAISSKAEFGIIRNPKYKNIFNQKKISCSNVVAIYKKDKTRWKKKKFKSLTLK